MKIIDKFFCATKQLWKIKKFPLITVLLAGYISIACIGFILINSVYSGEIQQGWVSDAIDSKEIRTSDLAQMIQQDILSGSYPNIAYKAMRSLERPDTDEIEVTMVDGYTVFSQKKPSSLPKEDLIEIRVNVTSSSMAKAFRPEDVIGHVRAVYRLDELKHHIQDKQVLIYWWLATVIIFSILIIYIFSKNLTKPLRSLSVITSIGSLNEISTYTGASRILEIYDLENKSREFANQLLKYQDIMVSKARDAAVGEITAQVVHDIRSPLAALNMVVSNLPQLPEDKRLIIRSAVGRIRDILNNLVGKKGTESDGQSQSERLQFSKHLLSTLIDSLVTEKRTQYRSMLRIEIDYSLDSNSYGLFAWIEPIAFARAVSNLIDNAVEASGVEGRIRVRLVPTKERVRIQIQDAGKGIPSSIIPELGERGKTFGKAGGTGLGLHYSKKVAEELGGTLKIESKENFGTTVTLEISLASPPLWFVERIAIKKNSAVVILDDDPSIHQIWQERIESRAAVDSSFVVINFSTPTAFKNWVRENSLDYDALIFLIDFELIGFKENGLDLIEELHIGPSSILVSSRYEDPIVRNRCEALSVQMIPKGMAGFVPIQIL